MRAASGQELFFLSQSTGKSVNVPMKWLTNWLTRWWKRHKTGSLGFHQFDHLQGELHLEEIMSLLWNSDSPLVRQIKIPITSTSQRWFKDEGREWKRNCNDLDRFGGKWMISTPKIPVKSSYFALMNCTYRSKNPRLYLKYFSRANRGEKGVEATWCCLVF